MNYYSVARRKFALASLSILLSLLAALAWLLPRARAAAQIQNSIAVASVSAASFVGAPAALAPNSIVAAFGTNLAPGTLAASSQPLPTTLLGTTVTVNGAPAPLYFVSPTQINYLIPAGTAAGEAEVVVTTTLAGGDQVTSRGGARIAAVAPAIFTANANGAGAPAAVTGRVNASGVFVIDPGLPLEPDPLQPGRLLPAPIDVGTGERPAFLILFGTGLRQAPAGAARALIGGVEVPITPAAAPGFTGLDQVNLQIPATLKGRGRVEVTLVAGGVSSNAVTVNLAGTPSAALAVSGFSVEDGALAGQTVSINGSGFSANAGENVVRFGGAQGRVISASGNQLNVIVPFGAESERVTVQSPLGEARSAGVFRVKTSISGIVQSTGAGGGAPVPLEGVSVRLVSENVTVRSNPQGSFVLANVKPGAALIEVDGGTAPANPAYPRVTLKMSIRADRDNQFAQPISMQQITGGSGSIGGGIGQAGQLSAAGFQRSAGRREQAKNDGLRAPANLLSAAISDRGVTLDVPLGTSVRFPDGKTNGEVQLTVVERSRLPGLRLPAGATAGTIAQITPFGTNFVPGASVSFPNDAGLAAGTRVDLYRYDFQAGNFVRRGTGTVTGGRVVSDGRVVDVASYWFAAVPGGVTTVVGRVIDGLGFPVPGAQVSLRGRSGVSDQNGGFAITDVAAAGAGTIQVEAVVAQQYGTPPRGLSGVFDAVAGGVTNVGAIALSSTSEAALVLSPFSVDFDSTSPPARLDVTLTQPAPPGGLAVTLASSAPGVAAVPAGVNIAAGQTPVSFNVTRVGPGVALIRAGAALGGSALESFAVVSVARPAPRLVGINPGQAPVGVRVVVSGTGLSPVPEDNYVAFLRDNTFVALADPFANEIVADGAGRPALEIAVPALASGPFVIVVAVADPSGVISDLSAPLNFTVLGSDVAAPQLAAVAPAQGKPRDQVTLAGSGFGATPAENLVFFRQNGLDSPARVLAAGATGLTVQVPSYLIARGSALVIAQRVAGNGAVSGPSNALDFTVTADAVPAARPTLAAVVNQVTGLPSGRDGDTIRAQGTGFGRLSLGSSPEDFLRETQMTLLLFYQGGELQTFAFPLEARDGTLLTAMVPTGLAAGAAQVTAMTLDVESGLISEESGPVSFQVSVGSLPLLDEDEPNDSPDLATVVDLPSIVEGEAAEDDEGDLTIEFDSGATETLHDLFRLTLDRQANLSLALGFAGQGADLDLFVLRAEPRPDGSYDILGSSVAETGQSEQILKSLPAGEYLIAVGAYRGASPYLLTVTEGSAGLEIRAEPRAGRRPLRVIRKS